MAQGPLGNKDTWEQCEALRHELAAARIGVSCAAIAIRRSVNPRARAREIIRERPIAAALTTLAIGIVAARVLPILLWRSKGSLLGRFTGELVKGAAGIALPYLASRIKPQLHRVVPPPNTVVFSSTRTPVIP